MIKQGRALRSRLSRAAVYRMVREVAVAAAVFGLARHSGWWPTAAAVVVVAVEWWQLLRPALPAGRRREFVVGRFTAVMVGVSVAVIISLESRLVSQILTAVVYAGIRWWWALGAVRGAGNGEPLSTGLWRLLVAQALLFEAVFLAAAILKPDAWAVLLLVWGGVYGSVYSVLSGWGERGAGVLAATWALVAAEVTWVLQLWLFTYTTAGGYVLVPQPALILTALAYCFGSVYWSQRQGNLSRGRLTEYLLIGLIMIVIVAVGTSWRGSI
jgi:hypothetical protein